MVVSDSKGIIERVRQVREYDNREQYAVRYNYKMTDVQAAMGRQQLKKLAGFIDRRREIARLYHRAFGGLDIDLPPDDSHHVFYRYTILVNQGVEKWIEQLRTEGVVSARPVFKPLHRYLNSQGCPQTEQVFKAVLSIPIYPSLSTENTTKVIEAVTRISNSLSL